MRKKTLIGIAMAALLALTLPATAQAENVPMSASGVITSISETYGKPAGSSGNFLVLDRYIYGTFTSGDVLGNFTMNYRGTIDITTQSGPITGTLTSSTGIFNVKGQLQPVIWTKTDTGMVGESVATGNWATQIGSGQGTFTADVYFVPTPDGHVASVLSGSTFTMSGKWNAKETT